MFLISLLFSLNPFVCNATPLCDFMYPYYEIDGLDISFVFGFVWAWIKICFSLC